MLESTDTFSIIAVAFIGICSILTLASIGDFKRKLLDFVSPIVFVAGWTILDFGVAPLLRLRQAAYDPETLHQWISVLVWISLGFAALIVGYTLDLGDFFAARFPRYEKYEWQPRFVIAASLILGALGFAGNVLFYQAVGGVQNYLSNFNNRILLWNKNIGPLLALRDMGLLAVILWYGYIVRPHIRRRLGGLVTWGLFAVLLAANLIPQLPLGSRTGVLRVFIDIAVIYHILKRRIKFWEFVGIGILLAGFVYAYGEMRFIVSRSHGIRSTQELIDDLSESTSNVSESGIAHEYDQYMSVLARIMDGVPNEVNYLHGSTYLLGFAYVVPRAIWSDKPPSAAVILTDQLFAGSYSGTSYLTPTMWGEAFMNFGYLGIIIIPFAFGVLFKGFNLYAKTSPVSPAQAVIYTIMLRWTDGVVLGDFVNVNGLLMIQFIALFLTCGLVSRASRVSLQARRFRRFAA